MAAAQPPDKASCSDLVTGDRIDDALLGGEGQDKLAGREGNDIILGDSGLNFSAPMLSKFDDTVNFAYWLTPSVAQVHSAYATAPMLGLQFQKIDNGASAANRFEVKIASATNPNLISLAAIGAADQLYGGSGNDWLFGEFEPADEEVGMVKAGISFALASNDCEWRRAA